MKLINYINNNRTKVNFISIVFGNFFYYGVQYFILILFTKNFNKETVGIYIFALAFIKPIFVPLNLQLRSLFVTETNDNLRIADYHSLRFLGNIATLVSILIVGYFSSVSNITVILLIGLIKIIESQSEICHAIFQKKQEMVFIGFSRIVNGTFTIILIVLGISFDLPFESIIMLWIGASLAVLVLLDIPKAVSKDKEFLVFKKYFNWSKIKSILKFAWPIFFLEIVSRYYESFPSLSVEKYFGLEMLAIFGSIIYFKAIGGQILTQIINIIEPKLATLWKESKLVQFHKLVMKLVILGLVIGFLFIIFLFFAGEKILEIIFTLEYASYSKLLVLIAISSAISYLYAFLSTSLTCMRKHHIKVPMRIVGLVFLVGLTYLNEASLTIYSFIYYLIYTELLLGVLYFLAYFYFLKSAKLTLN